MAVNRFDQGIFHRGNDVTFRFRQNGNAVPDVPGRTTRQHTDSTYSRRGAIRLGAAGLLTVATAVVGGSIYSEVTRPIVVKPADGQLTPRTGSEKDIDLSPKDGSVSLAVERGIPLSDEQYDAIVNRWRQLAILEPATHVRIAKKDDRWKPHELWKVGLLHEPLEEGDSTIDATPDAASSPKEPSVLVTFASDLFSDDPEMERRLPVEIPLAAMRSIPARVLAELNDGKKLKAVSDYVTFHADNVLTVPPEASPKAYREGIDVFNPYTYLYLTSPDGISFCKTQNADALGHMTNVGATFVVDIKKAARRINDLPREYSEENFAKGDYDYEDTNSAQRTLAFRTVETIYDTFLAFARPKGSDRKKGGLNDDVDGAIPGFGTLRIDLGMSRY